MSLPDSVEQLSQAVAILETRLGIKLADYRSEIARLKSEQAAQGGLPLGLSAIDDGSTGDAQDRLVALSSENASLRQAYAALEQRYDELRAMSAVALEGLDRAIAQMEGTAALPGYAARG